MTGACVVAEFGTAPSTRHIVATCGGGLVSRFAPGSGSVNTTGGAGAGGASAAEGAMVETDAGPLGAVTDATPGTCGCPCGCEPGCFCALLWVTGWAACVAAAEGGLAAVIRSGAVAVVPLTG